MHTMCDQGIAIKQIEGIQSGQRAGLTSGGGIHHIALIFGYVNVYRQLLNVCLSDATQRAVTQCERRMQAEHSPPARMRPYRLGESKVFVDRLLHYFRAVPVRDLVTENTGQIELVKARC